ncbi:glycoside hydrolase superfamily [Crepidotus variabilis]|uniref:glucan endo-1,3-beta-D-glucosidase n=1 Tax=Crepidotus variabilis TaxID=179855 RepID=A0A9P6JWI8_9AGAR|nr:glycoside hydrolase superfamily [Crepidotus variabilis]
MHFFSAFAALIFLVAPVLAGNNFHGLAASNSQGGIATYTCRTQEDWDSLARSTKDNGFGSLFISGLDCDALHSASRAAIKTGLTVLPAIFIHGTVANSESDINNGVQMFVSAVSEFGAGLYEGFLVGNEANDNTPNIVNKVDSVRGALRSAGINTPVSTTHTWVRVRDEPALCGDFVFANAHAFYDGGRTAAEAGDFVYGTVIPALKEKCPGKPIYITESGWPSQGGSNGIAVASPQAESNALSGLICAASKDRDVKLYAFEADNQAWKSTDVDKNFGILGKVGDAFNTC